MVDLIDENGRLFGLVNIIDLLVVLLVVAMVVAGFALVSGSGPDSDAEDVQRTTTVVTFESQTVEPYVAESIQNGSVGGSEVVAVRSKTVESATVVVPDQNGQLHVRQNPRLKDVTLRLELNTTQTPEGFVFSSERRTDRGYLVQKRALRIGQRLRLDIGDVTVKGNITSIDG